MAATSRRMAEAAFRAAELLREAGWVPLPPGAVADLHKRIAATEGLSAGDDCHELLTRLGRVVGYLEAFIGQPPALEVADAARTEPTNPN